MFEKYFEHFCQLLWLCPVSGGSYFFISAMVYTLAQACSVIFLLSSFLFSQRVQKCLQRRGFDVVHLLSTDVTGLCQGLLGSRGLMSQKHFEQEAAINSFSTLMSIIPGETYTESVKNFNDLPDRHAHDM
nr:eIF-2-alpha kinase activator GCN1 isoform X23 [Ipomoea batatas]